MLRKSHDEKIAFLKKFHFRTDYGIEFLTADDISSLLGVSRSHAYRIMKTGRLTDQQQRLLECEVFGAVHQWPGWKFKDGILLSPDDYKYEQTDLLRIRTMTERLRSQGILNDLLPPY